MVLLQVALPTVAAAVIVVAVCRYGIDAMRRLVVGVVAIAAKDERSRADRALAVLRDGKEPPEARAASPKSHQVIDNDQVETGTNGHLERPKSCSKQVLRRAN
jgi:hypothetical protein